MARGSTFGQVVTKAREEAGQSANASAGRNITDALSQTVRRVYQRLHEGYDWPHLETYADFALQEGIRYYGYPSKVSSDRIVAVYALETEGHYWREISYGIGPSEWNRYNPERDERADPVRAWQRWESSLEVWPVPLTANGTLRVQGFPAPRYLTNESDVVDLDDNMVALYAAGEWLARQNTADAEIKMQEAQRLFDRLKANQSSSNPIFPISSGASDRRQTNVIQIRAPRT